MRVEHVAQGSRGARRQICEMMPPVRRVLGAPAAVYLWLTVTLAGVVAAVVAGQAVWAVVGWAAAVVIAAVVVAVKTRRGR